MKNLIQTNSLMTLGAAALLLATQAMQAQTVFTDPIGINKITCLTNSDTIVGVPFRPQGSMNTLLTSNPVTAGSGSTATATLTLSLNNLATNSLGMYYVKFDGGTRDGRWYEITANGADTLTLKLNGDNLDGVVSGNKVVIAKFWTLDTLFPPAQATTSWTLNTQTGIQVPNGHAIVNSATASGTQRQTQLFLPNTSGTGVSRLPEISFYITGGSWRIPSVSGSKGNQILYPDTYIIIRHSARVTHPTVFRSFGEVEMKNFSIPLATNISGSRDTYVAIPRAIDVRLDQLNLVESGAFVASATVSGTQRRDQLYIYDNSTSQISKLPGQSYFFTNGNWRTGGNSNPQNHVIIPAGSGLVIRKYQTTNGVTSFWQNTPSY